ncbi:hypothetical protein STEG23_031832 [Scotinomys teguina]
MEAISCRRKTTAHHEEDKMWKLPPPAPEGKSLLTHRPHLTDNQSLELIDTEEIQTLQKVVVNRFQALKESIRKDNEGTHKEKIKAIEVMMSPVPYRVRDDLPK